MPEWYLVIIVLALLSSLGVLWQPLFYAVPFFIAAIAVPVLQSAASAKHASLGREARTRAERLKLRVLIAFLHFIQPCARLAGRLEHGLTPWRRRGVKRFAFPVKRSSRIWKERWKEYSERLRMIEAVLRSHGAVIRHGGEYDHWDFEVRGGLCGFVRIHLAIEEHKEAKQMILLRCRPKVFLPASCGAILFAVLSLLAFIDHSRVASLLLGSIALLFITNIIGDCASATATYLCAVKQVDGEDL